ncbi:MAG: PAS domain-containing protein, partial [Ferruginibacter sp.]
MLTPLKILILDSNPAQALEIERFLKKVGLLFKSKVIDKKVNFIRQLKYFKPDLILSDNCWAEFNAEEAIQLARLIIPEIPFILITDNDSKKYAINSLKIGVDNYIFKNRLTRLPMAIESAIKKSNDTKRLQRTEIKLLDSEARYRSMVERISDGFFSLDNHWNFVYANKHTAEIFKHPVSVLLGKNIWELFPQMINSPFYRAYHKAQKTQKNIFIEDFSVFLNKWIEAHIYPSPEGLVVYFLDVTRERSHKLKIKKTQEEYNNMIERVTDSFISL